MDRTRDNTTFIAGLIAIGLVVAGFVMWSHENSKAKEQSQVNEFYNAISADEGLFGGRDETVEPNHHVSIGLFIAGGFAALTALVIGASIRSASGPVVATISGQLTQLNELHASGSITTDEFVAAKTKLLRPES